MSQVPTHDQSPLPSTPTAIDPKPSAQPQKVTLATQLETAARIATICSAIIRLIQLLLLLL